MADGPFARLWRARARGGAAFERDVAVRCIHDDHADHIVALAQAATRAASIAHPALETVIDVVREGAEAFWVTSWIDGVSLATWIKSYRARSLQTPWPVAVAVAIEVLGALDALHVHGRAHEGMLTSAVRIDRYGRAHLLRSGIVTALREAGVDRTRLVELGLAATPPLELLGGGTPGASSDVFGTGWVLFESLAGIPPAKGTTAEVQITLVRGDLPDLASLRPDVPPAIVAIAERAMRANAKDRFDSAHAMARALAGVLRSANEDTSARTIARSVEEVAALTAPARVDERPSSPEKVREDRSLGLPEQRTMHVDADELEPIKRPLGIAQQMTEVLDPSELELLRIEKPVGLKANKTEFLDASEVDRLSIPEPRPKHK
jgi:serine/threonine protein kinase